MIRNALIAGATGLTGGELIRILIRSDYYNSIHLIGRRAFELEHPKVKSHIVDFAELKDFDPGSMIHDVYICLGTTMKKAGSKENFQKVDLHYVLETARWAKAEGVEKLAVISSIGTNPKTSNFYLKTKAEMEDALTQLQLPRLVIMRPSLLLGKREEFRFAEKLGAASAKAFSFLMFGSLRKYKAVQAEVVARAMFKSLINAEDGVTIVENEAIPGYL
jgi:uncharacterized protein YbjT (DUF2867 family)